MDTNLKYKAGDRVKINPQSRFGHQSAGSIGTITRTTPNEDYNYAVLWEAIPARGEFYYNDDDLLLVEECPLKKGDTVMMSTASPYFTTSDGEYNPINTLGEIISVERDIHYVRWENGMVNTYGIRDLVLVEADTVEEKPAPEKPAIKKGSRVLIAETSQYYGGAADSANPMNVIGTVTVMGFSPSVRWDNSRTNAYSAHDLRLATLEEEQALKEKTMKVGDRVRFHPDSYYNAHSSPTHPRDTFGTVTGHTSFLVHVEWDNGVISTYANKDLQVCPDAPPIPPLPFVKDERVRVRPGTRYYRETMSQPSISSSHPLHCLGTVVEATRTRVKVRWDNRTSMTYIADDLQKASDVPAGELAYQQVWEFYYQHQTNVTEMNAARSQLQTCLDNNNLAGSRQSLNRLTAQLRQMEKQLQTFLVKTGEIYAQ